MENIRIINFIAIVLGGMLFSTPLFSFAYEPETTHKALTQEMVKFFNHYTSNQISDEERENIMQGSVDEDGGLRALNHFYDPVHARGLMLGGNEFLAAKYWAQDTLAQASSDPVFKQRMYGSILDFFSSPSDFSWDRAVYEYTWGDKKKGLQALGHILHLIEDMAVPDHTRNDAHPPYADTVLHQSSPYEHWADQWNVSNVAIAEALLKEKKVPYYCNHLSSCFDSMALYSNNNFFSKDTILKNYDKPLLDRSNSVLEKLSDNEWYEFALHKDEFGNTYKLLLLGKRTVGSLTEELSIKDTDSLVISDYWSHLSKEAVLYGAGVMKLFFDEVEKEKQSKVLYEKNKSWFTKQWENVTDNLFGFASVFYGSSVTLDDLNDDGAALVLNPVFQNILQASSALPNETPIVIPQQVFDENIVSAATETASTVPIIIQEATSTEASSTAAIIPRVDYGGVVPPAPNTDLADATPQDTTPSDNTSPDISFFIPQCAQSLSPTSSPGCLLLDGELNLQWSSSASDLASYSISCTSDGNACSGFPLATTSTGVIFAGNDDTSYIFSVFAVDYAGNQSSTTSQTVEIRSRPIVINEIAWAGTSAAHSEDEWIELYNRSSQAVDISSFRLKSETDNKPNINLSGTIPSGGYYLIERTDDDTISDITASATESFGNGSGAGLLNTGEVLVLEYQNTILDQTPAVSACGGWCGGSATSYTTIERTDPDADGTLAVSWGRNNLIMMNGRNADNFAVLGTPGKRNSLNYLISQNGTVSADTVLTETKSPYLITRDITVASGKILRIDPGVIIKFTGQYSLFVDGELKILGVSENPVVLTSFKDDAYGGDLNADATSTAPARQNWNSVELRAGSSETSGIDYAVFRYGGKYSAGKSLLTVDSVSPTIQNSVFEESYTYGLWLKNSTSTVRNNTMKNVSGATLATPFGIYIQGGAPVISGNAIFSNAAGIGIDNSAEPTIENNSLTDNSLFAVSMANSSPVFSGNTVSNNSVNGVLMSGTFYRNVAFSNNLPYVVPANGTVAISPDATLTINAGAIVKFQNSSSVMEINGILNINGSFGNEAIFTSYYDDAHGGDTGNDGSAAVPSAGDWKGITIQSGSGTSTISYAKFLYGGKYFSLNPRAALKIDSTNAVISNSTFQYYNHRGLWLATSASSTISTSLFSGCLGEANCPIRPDSSGLYIESSTPLLENLTFRNNNLAIEGVSGSTVTVEGTIDIDSSNVATTSPSNLLP